MKEEIKMIKEMYRLHLMVYLDLYSWKWNSKTSNTRNVQGYAGLQLASFGWDMFIFAFLFHFKTELSFWFSTEAIKLNMSVYLILD